MSVRCSPGSPSQMMAALLRRHVGEMPVETVVGDVELAADEPLGVRRLPLQDRVPLPEPVQLGLGQPRPEGFGSSEASRLSASSSSRDLMCARSENSGGGGKTRSSWSTDSMLVVDEDIPRRPLNLRTRFLDSGRAPLALPRTTFSLIGVVALCTRNRPARQGSRRPGLSRGREGRAAPPLLMSLCFRPML